MTPPSRRAPGERAFAALMLLLSAFLLWQAFGISGLQSSTSAGAFPMAAAATMLVCALVIAVQASREDGSSANEASPETDGAPGARGARDGRGEWYEWDDPQDPSASATAQPRGGYRLIPAVVPATVGAIVAYMLVLEHLGFLPSSLVFLVGMTRLLGERRLRRNLLVSALALGVIHLVFTTVFAVALPGGRLWQGLVTGPMTGFMTGLMTGFMTGPWQGLGSGAAA
jgi:putative tricarboxylic transport membrane protein